MTDSTTQEPARRVRPYDFHGSEAVDRSRLRRLNPILEMAAHRIGGIMAGIVRAPVRVELGEVDQQRWEDFANTLPDPTLLVCGAVIPVGGKVALHIPLPFAMAVVEMRLGGEPSGLVPARPLTDIEQRLVGELADAALAESVNGLSPVMPMTIVSTTAASSAVFLQVANPNEICLLIALNVELAGKHQFEVALCMPQSIVRPLLDALERMDNAEVFPETASSYEALRERISDAPLDVSVCFPEVVLSSEEVLNLTVGDVIALHCPEGTPLRLMAAGVQFGEVVATSQGKRLACMVVELSQPRRSDEQASC